MIALLELCIDILMAYYTNIIFQNRKITFDETDNDYHKVIALEDLQEGELLFMEHLADNKSSSKIIAYVKNNKYLFDTLHPRTKKEYTHDDRFVKSKEVEDLAIKKVIKNVFRLNEGTEREIFAIGKDISKFNHNNYPNCNMIIRNIDKKNIQLQLCSVKANKYIKKGDELFIYYGKNMIFDDDNIFCDNEKNTFTEPTLEFNKMELKIATNYMCKPVFYNVYNNLAQADNLLYYKYDEESIIIGVKNGKTKKI